MLLLREAWRWARRNLSPSKRQVLLRRYLTFAEYSRINPNDHQGAHSYQRKMWLVAAGLQDPALLREAYFWQRLLPGRLFSKSARV
jgi:hypothetical protein